MNITDEHIKKAQEIAIMLKRLEPQVLYRLADFMDFEGQSDEGMYSQCAYEAAERADVYSTDGEPQTFALDLGMSLGRINVQFKFQKVDEESFLTETFDVLTDKP